MIENPHAIRNEDESVWIDFEGRIPRVGDEVSISHMKTRNELSDELANKKWLVYKVLWFISNWRIKPYPDPDDRTQTISQARVYIK